MDVPLMSTDEALALATQVARDTVQLVAVQYNWGPPVSGRFDNDFMNIWAAAQEPARPGSVLLHGAHANGDWSIETPFDRAASFSNPAGIDYQLFSLALGSANDFPAQFVLRFDDGNGNVHYDNNHGANYVVEPYRGWGLSSVRSGAYILDLGRILPCQLFLATVPARAERAGSAR